MMNDFSLTPTSPTTAEQENHAMDDHTFISCMIEYLEYYRRRNITLLVIFIFICIFCLFGLLGNGTVIWLLGFRMKRNPFTVYVLNLAVADSVVLISSISRAVLMFAEMSSYFVTPFLKLVNLSLLCFPYSLSQFLLTAISLDRCVAVLCPLWYRFRRPKKLSTVLCAIIWIFSFVGQGIGFSFLLFSWDRKTIPPLFYAFLVNAVICLPLITVSTLILFFRFCFKSQQLQRGKLLTVILLTLSFFLIFAFPLNVIYLITFNSSSETYCKLLRYKVTEYGLLCACLNSFVNPFLYFLVGRKKKGLCRENLKLVLRGVFMEEEEEEEEEACREEPGTQLQDLQKPHPTP